MPRAKSLFPIGTSAVKVPARLAARNAVKTQGVRVSHVPYAQIIQRANDYLAAHPELYAQALERAQREGMIDHYPMMMER